MDSLVDQMSCSPLSAVQLKVLLEKINRKGKKKEIPWISLVKMLIDKMAETDSLIVLHNVFKVIKSQINQPLQSDSGSPKKGAKSMLTAYSDLITYINYSLEESDIPLYEISRLISVILPAVIDLKVQLVRKEKLGVAEMIYSKMTSLLGHSPELIIDSLLHCKTLIFNKLREPEIFIPVIRYVFSALKADKLALLSLSPELYLKYLVLGKFWLFMTSAEEVSKTRLYIIGLLKMPSSFGDWASQADIPWLKLKNFNTKSLLKAITISSALQMVYSKRCRVAIPSVLSLKKEISEKRSKNAGNLLTSLKPKDEALHDTNHDVSEDGSHCGTFVSKTSRDCVVSPVGVSESKTKRKKCEGTSGTASNTPKKKKLKEDSFSTKKQNLEKDLKVESNTLENSVIKKKGEDGVDLDVKDSCPGRKEKKKKPKVKASLRKEMKDHEESLEMGNNEYVVESPSRVSQEIVLPVTPMSIECSEFKPGTESKTKKKKKKVKRLSNVEVVTNVESENSFCTDESNGIEKSKGTSSEISLSTDVEFSQVQKRKRRKNEKEIEGTKKEQKKRRKELGANVQPAALNETVVRERDLPGDSEVMEGVSLKSPFISENLGRSNVQKKEGKKKRKADLKDYVKDAMVAEPKTPDPKQEFVQLDQDKISKSSKKRTEGEEENKLLQLVGGTSLGKKKKFLRKLVNMILSETEHEIELKKSILDNLSPQAKINRSVSCSSDIQSKGKLEGVDTKVKLKVEKQKVVGESKQKSNLSVETLPVKPRRRKLSLPSSCPTKGRLRTSSLNFDVTDLNPEKLRREKYKVMQETVSPDVKTFNIKHGKKKSRYDAKMDADKTNFVGVGNSSEPCATKKTDKEDPIHRSESDNKASDSDLDILYIGETGKMTPDSTKKDGSSDRDEASGSDEDIVPCDENNQMFTDEETRTYHQKLLEADVQQRVDAMLRREQVELRNESKKNIRIAQVIDSKNRDQKDECAHLSVSGNQPDNGLQMVEDDDKDANIDMILKTIVRDTGRESSIEGLRNEFQSSRGNSPSVSANAVQVGPQCKDEKDREILVSSADSTFSRKECEEETGHGMPMNGELERGDICHETLKHKDTSCLSNKKFMSDDDIQCNSTEVDLCGSVEQSSSKVQKSENQNGEVLSALTGEMKAADNKVKSQEIPVTGSLELNGDDPKLIYVGPKTNLAITGDGNLEQAQSSGPILDSHVESNKKLNGLEHYDTLRFEQSNLGDKNDGSKNNDGDVSKSVFIHSVEGCDTIGNEVTVSLKELQNVPVEGTNSARSHSESAVIDDSQTNEKNVAQNEVTEITNVSEKDVRNTSKDLQDIETETLSSLQSEVDHNNIVKDSDNSDHESRANTPLEKLMLSDDSEVEVVDETSSQGAVKDFMVDLQKKVTVALNANVPQYEVNERDIKNTFKDVQDKEMELVNSLHCEIENTSIVKPSQNSVREKDIHTTPLKGLISDDEHLKLTESYNVLSKDEDEAYEASSDASEEPEPVGCRRTRSQRKSNPLLHISKEMSDSDSSPLRKSQRIQVLDEVQKKSDSRLDVGEILPHNNSNLVANKKRGNQSDSDASTVLYEPCVENLQKSLEITLGAPLKIAERNISRLSDSCSLIQEAEFDQPLQVMTRGRRKQSVSDSELSKAAVKEGFVENQVRTCQISKVSCRSDKRTSMSEKDLEGKDLEALNVCASVGSHKGENSPNENKEMTLCEEEGDEIEVLSTSGVDEDDEDLTYNTTVANGESVGKHEDVGMSMCRTRKLRRRLLRRNSSNRLSLQEGKSDSSPSLSQEVTNEIEIPPRPKAQLVSEAVLAAKEILISPVVSDEECELVSPGLANEDDEMKKNSSLSEGLGDLLGRLPCNDVKGLKTRGSKGGIRSPQKVIPEEQDESSPHRLKTLQISKGSPGYGSPKTLKKSTPVELVSSAKQCRSARRLSKNTPKKEDLVQSPENHSKRTPSNNNGFENVSRKSLSNKVSPLKDQIILNGKGTTNLSIGEKCDDLKAIESKLGDKEVSSLRLLRSVSGNRSQDTTTVSSPKKVDDQMCLGKELSDVDDMVDEVRNLETKVDDEISPARVLQSRKGKRSIGNSCGTPQRKDHDCLLTEKGGKIENTNSQTSVDITNVPSPRLLRSGSFGDKSASFSTPPKNKGNLSLQREQKCSTSTNSYSLRTSNSDTSENECVECTVVEGEDQDKFVNVAEGKTKAKLEVEKAVVKTPVREKAVVKTPVRENTVVKTPVRENAVVKTPVREKAVVKTPVREKAEVKTPVREKAEVKTPVREKAEVKTPVREKAVVKTPVQEKAVVKTPVREKAVVKTPVRRSSRLSLVRFPSSPSISVRKIGSNVKEPPSSTKDLSSPTVTKNETTSRSTIQTRRQSLSSTIIKLDRETKELFQDESIDSKPYSVHEQKTKCSPLKRTVIVVQSTPSPTRTVKDISQAKVNPKLDTKEVEGIEQIVKRRTRAASDLPIVEEDKIIEVATSKRHLRDTTHSAK